MSEDAGGKTATIDEGASMGATAESHPSSFEEMVVRSRDDTLRFSIKDYPITQSQVRRSIAFNHDDNLFHQEPVEAQRLLLSTASSGFKLARCIEKSVGTERSMDINADFIRAQGAFTIAPGVWLAALFDAFFTFPEKRYKAAAVLEVDEAPSLDLDCRVTYAHTKYTFPRIVQWNGITQVDLDFSVKRKKIPGVEEDVGARAVTFKISTRDLSGSKLVPVQQTQLDVFPMSLDPHDIMTWYQPDLEAMTIKYSKGSVASINGEPALETTPHNTGISESDLCNYGASIGRPDLGTKCATVSPLALQMKIPRILFLQIPRLNRTASYQALMAQALGLDATEEAYTRLGDTVVEDGDVEAAKNKAAAMSRMRLALERRKAIEAYVGSHNCPHSVDDLLRMQQRVYISQETFFDPRQPLPAGQQFAMGTSLRSYDMERNVGTFVCEAKRKSGWRGLKGRDILMRGITKISVAPFNTKVLMDYLRNFRLPYNLERF